MTDFPDRLDDGTVLLRPVVESDAPVFAAAFAEDPELWVRLGMARPWTEPLVIKGIADEAEGRASGEWARWAITLAADDVLVGSLLLRDVDRRHRNCELGIWLASGARRTGIGTRAMALAQRIGFSHLGLNRIYLHTETINRPMRALAARAGFREEGVLREHELNPDGAFADIVVAARLARD